MANVNAISMQTGYHTEGSMPSVALSGFKNILAMMFQLDYKNCQRFEDVKNNKGSV